MKIRRTIWISALCILLATQPFAQVDRSEAPKPTAQPKVHLKDANVRKLPNGMTLVIVQDPKVPLTSIQLMLDIEPFVEGELAGLSSMVGDMLRSGTRTMAKEQMDQEIDMLGASVYTYSDGFYASCLSRNAAKLLGILYQISTNCTFPPAEFEKVKKKRLSAIAASENDPDAISARVGDVVRYKKGHPYGQVARSETIEKIFRKHVKMYYDHYFVPENAYLVVVGNTIDADVIGTIDKTFGTWKVGTDPRSVSNKEQADEFIGTFTHVSQIEKYPAPPRENIVHMVDRSGAQQSVIDITYPVFIQPNDPNALVAQVMNGVLGGGAFNSRLNQNLREDKGFTYGAFSSLSTDEYIGSFSAKASARNAVTDSSISEMMFEIQNMKDELVSEEELELTKNVMAGRFARSLEDPRTIARFELNKLLYNLSEDHYKTWLQRLDTISPASVLAMARNYLKPSNCHIVVVGDKEEVGNKISKFSKRGVISQLDKYGERYREVVTKPAQDVTPETVINDFVAAIGGRGKLVGRKSEVIRMTSEINGLPVVYTTYRKYPNKYFAEMTANGQQLQKVVYDGVQGIRGELGEAGVLVDVELAELGYEADMNFFMKYVDLSFDLRVPGTTQVKGKDAYKLMVTTDSGNMFEEYYDVNTKLKVKKVERKSTSSGQQVITTYYEDYKEVQGILYPHTITQSSNMKLTFKVESIEIDGEVDDDLFLIK